MNGYNAIDGFKDAMQRAGVPCDDHIQADGKLVRFNVVGDRRGKKTGWYIFHDDGLAAGSFGCWKRGVSETWCSKSGDTMTDSERQAYRAKIEAQKLARQEAKDAAHAAAAERAEMIWAAAEPAVSHPYLDRKNVLAYGVRVGRWTREDENGRVWLDVHDALIIPIRKGKKLVSLQAIFPDKNNAMQRDKDFLSGGEKRGCFFSIGKPESDTATIVICEGYATGATIYQATGLAVIVAFDAGNLRSVGEVVRKRYPMAVLVFAADNDRWTTEPRENPGKAFAEEAAQSLRGWVALPEFEDLSGKPTDFNDMAQQSGLVAVKTAILGCIAPDLPVVEPVQSVDPLAAAVAEHRVDYVSLLIDCNDKGKPRETIANLQEVLRRLRITARYNVIKKEIELLIPGQGFSLDNEANACLAFVESECAKFGLTTSKVGQFLTYIGDRNQYNPVTEWIFSNPWDGISRLPAFYSTVKAVGEEDDSEAGQLKEILLRRWLLSAVAAVCEPNGVSAHGVLVLQGEQYLGKTKWFKSLAPASLGVLQDGVILKPDDRDSVKQAVCNWLVELGELDATFKKSDISQLKAFITKDRDVMRRAYAKLESTYARRTVFFASVNPRQFLHDPTGNRRYWTISCEDLNCDHGIDMQQLWAEVYQTIYKTGEKWFLLPDEMAMLNRSNKEYEVIDPIEDRLHSRYDWESDQSYWRWLSATDVMLELGFDRCNHAEVTRCGALIAAMNGDQRKRQSAKRLLLVPVRRDF